MKFTGTIDIDLPKARVAELFANPDHLGEYQDGFVRKELIKGAEGQNGAVSKMYYQYGKRDMELTETIISNQLPDSFLGHYHHKHMDNSMKCTFTELSENRTRYTTEVEYTRINWFLPRLMAILFPGMYRKQGYKWMVNFKRFAESQ